MQVTVMIVDDSKLARIVAARTLAALQPDWKRVEATSAAEALKIVSEQQVNVALIDFNMADKDGLALAAELRDAHPDLPIAIVTANLQDEIVARARALDATFVAKPVTADGLEPFITGTALRLRVKNA